MAVTYTWKVTGLKTTTMGDQSDVVIQTYWEKIGTDGEFTGVFSGATPFTANSLPAGTPFVPFNRLSEEKILDWIKLIVTANTNYATANADLGLTVSHVETQEDRANMMIQQQIDAQRNAVADATLPWAID